MIHLGIMTLISCIDSFCLSVTNREVWFIQLRC